MTGSGTQADPYIISDVDDLQAMNDNRTAYYELGGDIDASATSDWNDGAGFVPIGDLSVNFTGHFDGKGFAIDQLFINLPTTRRVGLFGDTRPAGIKNVELTLCDITGKEYVGALAGRVYGYAGGIITIENCSSSGSVSGERWIGGLLGRVSFWDYIVQVQDCHSSCTITATNGYVGGLIGDFAFGNASNCYATGDVTVVAGDVFCHAGGFAGSIYDGVVSKCYATGNASATSINTGTRRVEVGGFVGAFSGSLSQFSDCYARGNATASATNGLAYAGGFLGRQWASEISDEFCDNCFSTGIPTGANAGGFCGESILFTITNCFWDTETSGTEISDGGTGKTTAEMKTESTFTDAGWDFDTIWGMRTDRNDGYAYFQWQFPEVIRIKGNPNIDQRMFQHIERIDR